MPQLVVEKELQILLPGQSGEGSRLMKAHLAGVFSAFAKEDGLALLLDHRYGKGSVVGLNSKKGLVQRDAVRKQTTTGDGL